MPSFHPFSTQHFATLAVGSVVLAVLIGMGKREGKPAKAARTIFAISCLGAYPMNLIAWRSLGIETSIDTLYPFHLCDIAAFIAGFAILYKNQLLRTLTYFWGLAATMQALLTPAITVGFPTAPFITFFIQHFGIVGVALYLPIVEGWRPSPPFWKGPLTAFLWADVYLVFAFVVNLALKSNFGFVMHPPENPSLIDKLGPWPWYLLSFQVIALGIFKVLNLPFRKKI